MTHTLTSEDKANLERLQNQIKTALLKTNGVNEVVKVSHESGSAIVKYDSEKINTDELVKAVKELGYDASIMTASITQDDKIDNKSDSKDM